MNNNNNKVFLSLGSNLGNSSSNIQTAIAHISYLVGKVISISSLYNSEAQSLPSDDTPLQPDYTNCVIAIETTLTPSEALNKCQKIESSMGRDKSKEARWGPRIIDIDILTFNDLVFESPELLIPHIMLTERDFVLVPLREIAPDFIHPRLKISVEDMILDLKKSNKKTFLK
jgi:2-amino-4-hydroxy-6-hydroxymethyldihydropteridine diphosphokinase